MDANRTLVVYYSRTGNTQDVARAIRDELGCEIERISDRERRRGVLGYLRSGLQAALRRPVELRPMSTNPRDYDLVIVGTPIWNASVSAPVRAYLKANRDSIPRVAFFCTYGGSPGSARALRQMGELCRKSPIATLALTEDEVHSADVLAVVRSFTAALKTIAPAERAATIVNLIPAPAWGR